MLYSQWQNTNWKLTLYSYIPGYLLKSNTYETHNLKNQNLPTIEYHIHEKLLYFIYFLFQLCLSSVKRTKILQN